jgi:serine/threonine protein kinase
MAEFVRAQIFGTTFEITSRYAFLPPASETEIRARTGKLTVDQIFGPTTCGNGCFRARLVGFSGFTGSTKRRMAETGGLTRPLWGGKSSARDQLTGQPVAVKKIMKPFSTPVLSKRTYRELKLLKHLRHENVGSTCAKDRSLTVLVLTTH